MTVSPSRAGLWRRALPALALAMAGCAALPVAQLAIPAIRKMILSVASTNYEADYTRDLEGMLDALLGANRVRNADQGLSPFEVEPTALAGGGAGQGAGGASGGAGQGSGEPAGGAESAPVAAAATPIELEVGVYREARVDGVLRPVLVEDGEVLRDDHGVPGSGDNLKFTFRTDQPAYVYVISIDSSGWAQPVFPGGGSSFSNPVEPGRTYEVPENDEWFYLDDYRGIETYFFVASRGPRADLEPVLSSLAGRTRPPATQSLAMIDQPTGLARGLAGRRTGATSLVQTHDGAQHQVDTTLFQSSLEGEDLVVTRWFRHE